MKKAKGEAIIALAHHEAGHAVISRALGLKVDSVNIIPDLDNAGICYHEMASYLALAPSADLASKLSAIEKDVIVTLAGPHAECQYRSLDFNAATVMREAAGWDSDLKKAKYLVELALELSGRFHGEYDQLFEEFSFTTENMVNEHRSAIERVAHGLLEFSELKQRDVDDLIGSELVERFMHEADEAYSVEDDDSF